MAYKITVDYSSHGYNRNVLFTPQGAVVHETAWPGKTDEGLQDYFDAGADGRGVCSHAGIDWDSITEMVPPTRRAYHAGTHANCMFIGVELCHPKTHDPAKFTEVWNRAVWYFAHLYVDGIIPVKYHNYKITKDNLLSHNEVSLKWPKDTNHIDPTAYFKEYGKTVDDFRAAVQKEVNDQLLTAKAGKQEEDLIEAAIYCKVLTSGAYWLNVIRGSQKANPAYVKQLLKNATGCTSDEDSEILAAAVRAGLLTDIAYWTAVLKDKKGKTTANPAYIIVILQRATAPKGVKIP